MPQSLRDGPDRYPLSFWKLPALHVCSVPLSTTLTSLLMLFEGHLSLSPMTVCFRFGHSNCVYTLPCTVSSPCDRVPKLVSSETFPSPPSIFPCTRTANSCWLTRTDAWEASISSQLELWQVTADLRGQESPLKKRQISDLAPYFWELLLGSDLAGYNCLFSFVGIRCDSDES